LPCAVGVPLTHDALIPASALLRSRLARPVSRADHFVPSSLVVGPDATEKQPYAIVAADGQPLAMAGLWERWRDRAAGDVLQSFTIMTTVPNELCAAISFIYR
jgi:hypothetical protein